MKKLIIFSILLAAIVLSAVNPWPAQLKVWNWTGDNIYFRLSYRGEQKYFLTATPQGNTDTYRFSLFEVARKKYSSEVTACGVTTTGGSMNLNNNLKLTFTDCAMMRQWWRPLYWGEPGMEKPNFYQDAKYLPVQSRVQVVRTTTSTRSGLSLHCVSRSTVDQEWLELVSTARVRQLALPVRPARGLREGRQSVFPQG